jgi:putative ATP-binding cassette transporter
VHFTAAHEGADGAGAEQPAPLLDENGNPFPPARPTAPAFNAEIASTRFAELAMADVLMEIALGELVQRYPDLNIIQDWPRLLSLGEQQRLAFARLRLNAPSFVVLDEATSALDVATERHLYSLLSEREMAFVSVGHRPTLTAFHDTVLELDGSGKWRLLPAAGYDVGRHA